MTVATETAATQQPNASSLTTGRRDDIQGLRTLAVVAVVVFHAGLWVPGGFVGVDMFFVISGYVITAMLMREHSAHGRIRFRRFYLRRFKRLTPALALMIIVTTAASALIMAPVGPQETAAKTAIGAILLGANIVIARTTGGYFGESAEQNPLLHTWSLSVEEQFYIVFPALLALIWTASRTRRGRQALGAAVVALVGIGSFALALLGSIGISALPDSLVGFYGPVTRAWEFAAGALLALAASRIRLRTRLATLLGTLGVGALIASLWLINDQTPFPGAWTLLPVLAMCLLIAAGGADNAISRALSSRPMVTIGDLSYSIYLWHWPFIVFSGFLWPGVKWAPMVAAVISLIPALLSYTFVEQPIRGREFERADLAKLVAVVVLPPILLAAAVLVSAGHGYWNATVLQYQEAVKAHHAGMAAGCTRSAWEKVDVCTSNPGADGAPVYLVGDSNADHFREAVDAAGLAMGRPVVGLTEDGCAYLQDIEDQTLEKRDRCGPYPALAGQYLKTAPDGLVIVANSYLGWRETKLATADAGSRDAPNSSSVQALDELTTSLTATVVDLQNSGHQVVLVQAIPHWGDDKKSLSWAGCSVPDMLTDNCGRFMPLTDTRAATLRSRAVVDSVASAQSATVMDVAEQLCPAGRCESVSAEGMVRYRDGTHISVPQSRDLDGVFTEAIRNAANG